MVGISRPADEPSSLYRPGTFEGFVARLLLPPIVIEPAGVRVIGVLAILLAVWTDVLFYRTDPGREGRPDLVFLVPVLAGKPPKKD